MRRLWSSLAVLSIVSLSPVAYAAQVTDVADAAEEDDPIDVHVEVLFDFVRHTGLITRENTQPAPNDPNGPERTADVKELEYERLKLRLRPRLEVGVFHDLALFTEWPIVLYDQQKTRFADGTTAANSTITRDLNQAGTPTTSVQGWPETEGAGNDVQAIQDGRFGFPGKGYTDWGVAADGSFEGYRANIDNPVFGIKWSPLNNERDETKPTITLQADYTAPFFGQMNPTGDVLNNATIGAAPAADGLHKFHFQVGMSKRTAIFDPYFLVEYTIPFVGNVAPEVLGHQPRQFGGFTGGVEIVPYEDKKLKQKFALILQGSATYFSEGRDYSEVSDLFKEMTYTDQFIRVGGRAGLRFSTYDIFFLNIQGLLNYDTEHFLTIEDFGRDLDDANDEIDLDNPLERNVYYNPAIDTVGRRLRIEQSLQVGFIAHIGVTF